MKFPEGTRDSRPRADRARSQGRVSQGAGRHAAPPDLCAPRSMASCMNSARSPTLNKNQRHTIEVMVDRLAIRSGIEKRLGRFARSGIQVRAGPAQNRAAGWRERAGDLLQPAFRVPSTAEFRIRKSRRECFPSTARTAPARNAPASIDHVLRSGPRPFKRGSEYFGWLAIAPWATMNYILPILEALAAHYSSPSISRGKRIPPKVRKKILEGSGDERSSSRTRRHGHRHGLRAAVRSVFCNGSTSVYKGNRIRNRCANGSARS